MDIGVVTSITAVKQNGYIYVNLLFYCRSLFVYNAFRWQAGVRRKKARSGHDCFESCAANEKGQHSQWTQAVWFMWCRYIRLFLKFKLVKKYYID